MAGPAPGGDVQAARAATFADEWRRAGLAHAVVCPGSRSTPMALALDAAGFEMHVRLDERSAGFTALGLALASSVPAVLLTTSGTAAAEVHAAVVEAHHAGVPMLVCTADRPPELQAVAAPQTIDQRGLYGGAVRFEADAGVADRESRHTWRAFASRLVLEACRAPAGPGPVHCNLPHREPLVGRPDAVPPGRPGGRPWHSSVGTPAAGVAGRPDPASPGPGGRDDPADVVGFLAGRRGVVVAGAGCGDPEAVWALADRLAWPVLADPRSPCRRDRPGVVVAADAFLRDAAVGAALRPEAVLRLGSAPASKVLAAFVDGAPLDAPQILVDPYGRFADPGRVASHVVRADPATWCRAAAAVATPAPPAWRRRWQAVDGAARDAFAGWADAQRDLSEPLLARSVAEAAADRNLVVSSSMPIRDLEWFAPLDDRAPRVYANRGVNGIDGVVSTALGVALAGGPTLALVGDLAFLHDLTAWVRPAGFDPPCTVVVADNGGGGIFSFLAQADEVPPDRFEALFATPQAVDVAAVARGLSVPVTEVVDRAGLRAALEPVPARLGIVRVRLPGRSDNVARHAEVQGEAARGARQALALPSG